MMAAMTIDARRMTGEGHISIVAPDRAEKTLMQRV